MKERQQPQQLAKDPSTSNPQNPGTAEEPPSDPRALRRLKRQKAATDVQVSSTEKAESESPSSALDTVSGLKFMSVLQNMNMLSLEMISRKNNLQILEDLKRDHLGGDDEEPAGAGAGAGKKGFRRSRR